MAYVNRNVCPPYLWAMGGKLKRLPKVSEEATEIRRMWCPLTRKERSDERDLLQRKWTEIR